MAKQFRPVNFDFPFTIKITREMFKLIKEKASETGSMSQYIRNLIKKDLNCNDYGKKN